MASGSVWQVGAAPRGYDDLCAPSCLHDWFTSGISGLDMSFLTQASSDLEYLQLSVFLAASHLATVLASCWQPLWCDFPTSWAS